jgi:hypothetical protein
MNPHYYNLNPKFNNSIHLIHQIWPNKQQSWLIIKMLHRKFYSKPKVIPKWLKKKDKMEASNLITHQETLLQLKDLKLII